MQHPVPKPYKIRINRIWQELRIPSWSKWLKYIIFWVVEEEIVYNEDRDR